MNQAEKNVSSFYNSGGWDATDGVTEDARLWEDMRPCAREYVSNCRLRVLRHIPEKGRYMLDMASGPIQYPEYLLYSKGFEKRYCVDLSDQALGVAKSRIGDHGVFLHGSFFDLPFEDDFFDCAVSLHTIYHMDADLQEVAVRKLIRITKPGNPVIIIYSNPNSIISAFLRRIRGILRNANILKKDRDLYFNAFPVDWWSRFSDVADVKVLPWRSFTARQQKILLPDNGFGKWMFRVLFRLEELFPKFFSRNFTYPMIVLTKKDKG